MLMRGSLRRGNASVAIVGALGFAVVLGALGWVQYRRVIDDAVAPPVAAVTTPVDQPVAAPAAKTVAVAEPAPQAVAPIGPSREELVQQHLAAGEFGRALELALASTDSAEQDRLIRLVADAQTAAGDYTAALATLKKVPAGFEKGGDSEMPQQPSLAGGTGADFGPLIDLIQAETGDETYGPWEDIHGTGGTAKEFESGVRVDPHGVLALVTAKDASGRLTGLSDKVRDAAINTDMARPSDLRMVSLTRLEQAVAERIAAGKPVVESMRQLAGLSEIQYVFVYPEEREIVVAGPAAGWGYDATGRAVDVQTGRPTLQLDDLVTVLRTFSKSGLNIFGCSIDPRSENLRQLKEFVAQSQARGPLPEGGAGRWAKQLQEKLGMQDVSVYGVPADSRVARVIVEADYRMKLIGIGKLRPTNEIDDYFSILAEHPEAVNGRIDALRWWLTLNCQQVTQGAGGNAFEIQKASVLCQSENEFLNAQGQRVHTGAAEPANRQFAASFTQHYADLAKAEPIFADAQGVFSLALVAALIQHDSLDQKAHWSRGCFAPGGSFVTARYAVPREVETAVNHRVFNGRDVIVQVAGGVKGDLVGLLEQNNLRQTSTDLDGVAARHRASELPAGRWWWDAK